MEVNSHDAQAIFVCQHSLNSALSEDSFIRRSTALQARLSRQSCGSRQWGLGRPIHLMLRGGGKFSELAGADILKCGPYADF